MQRTVQSARGPEMKKGVFPGGVKMKKAGPSEGSQGRQRNKQTRTTPAKRCRRDAHGTGGPGAAWTSSPSQGGGGGPPAVRG